MIRSAFIALSLAATVTLQAADLKIGVIDMSKVFQEFHKTKSAAEKYKGNYEKAAQEMQERQTVYKSLAAEAQKLQKVAQDPIITPEQRNKHAAELGEKVKEIRSMEMEMQEFAERRQTQLKQEDMQISVPKLEERPEESLRTGVITYFNDHKGFGFIIDAESREKIFFHVNDLNGPVKENDRVYFTVGKSPKGPVAQDVNVVKA